MHVRIRQALPADAAGVIALLERLYAETTFLLYEPGEMNVSAEPYAKRMAEGIEKQNWVMFIAEDGEELIGTAFGSRGQAKRTVHSSCLGLAFSRRIGVEESGRLLLLPWRLGPRNTRSTGSSSPYEPRIRVR